MTLNDTTKLVNALRKIILRIFISGSIIFGVTACPIDTWEDFETEYTPVLMHIDDLENSVQFIGKRPLESPGKIYYKDSIVFINEKYKGVHIIDNHDPSNPVNIGFVTIPGSLDIVMKGNILYADNARDLVAISLANYSEPIVTQRIKNIFPELYPPDDGYLPEQYQIQNRPKNTVIVEWVKIKY